MEWRIELLGGLRARRGDNVVTRFRTHKTGALLAYLAFYHRSSHPREELIELHWPECDPLLGRRSLRTALSALRQQLEQPDLTPGSVIVADRQTVQCNAAACVTDVAEFETALKLAAASVAGEQAGHLIRAVDLYHDRLLRGYTESWILAEQQRLDELFFRAIFQLGRLLEAGGDIARAIHYARHAVSLDPLREESRCELIRLLAAAGQSGTAL